MGIHSQLAWPINALCNAAIYFGLLAGVTLVGAVVAAVNPAIRPFLFSCGYGSMTSGIGANFDLVSREGMNRHPLVASWTS